MSDAATATAAQQAEARRQALLKRQQERGPNMRYLGYDLDTDCIIDLWAPPIP